MVNADTQAMMMYDVRKKSMLLAYLLWWFLGAFGAHRFYLGRIGSGVVMLILFLISFVLTFVFIGIFGFLALGVWWLIDAFLIYSITTQHNYRLARDLATH